MDAKAASLQTAIPLQRLRLSATAATVNAFWMWHNDGDLDMDQPYQRGHVWGEDRQRQLIRSLILGVPIPSLIINQRHLGDFTHPGYDDARNAAYAVVDGKQRITAIIRWLSGGLMVPATWFPTEDIAAGPIGTDLGPMVRFIDLAKPRQLDIRTTPMSLVQGRLSSLADEQVVFDLINFGGVPQGESDFADTEPCPYAHAHTRDWCGRPGCRES